MLENCTLTCEATGCDRPLDGEDPALVLETAAGRRHAYECACGAVTITVVRTDGAARTE